MVKNQSLHGFQQRVGSARKSARRLKLTLTLTHGVDYGEVENSDHSVPIIHCQEVRRRGRKDPMNISAKCDAMLIMGDS